MHINRPSAGPAISVMLALASFAVICPIFDYDLYWHLAFGREMAATGQIIQHEPFSHTAAGTPFNNRVWLAQWLFYQLQHHAGWHALQAVKLSVTLAVALLMFFTARFYGASIKLAALCASLGILAGHYRYTERPEIFSLLLIALLAFLLAGWKTGKLHPRWLWLAPPLMLVWDWLHGGIFGLVFFIIFVVVENMEKYVSLGKDATRTPGRLNWIFAATLLVMLANPLGLTTYGEFFGHLGGMATPYEVRNVEYWPANWHEYKSFWIVSAVFGLLFIVRWKSLPLGHCLAALAFVILAMRVSRMVGVAMILAAPMLGVALTGMIQQANWQRIAGYAGALLLALVLLADGIDHKLLRDESPRKLGWKLDEQFFPVGGVRFVKENGITGKLFNTGHLGGYLAWALYPHAKVFHYNNGATFGDPYRFWGRPDLLDTYGINYAFIAHEEEFKLFPAHSWARIYRDAAAALVLKRAPENTALIARFEWRQFHPMMTSRQLDLAALHPATATRLFEEMVIYLAYREDTAIATELVRLANRNPQAAQNMGMPDQLGKAVRRNPSLAQGFQR